MSLPTKWVEALFTKLQLAYGRDFIGRWEGVDLNDVKTDWGHELAGFEGCPEAIAYALAHLPPKAPTVMEFRDICRKAPRVESDNEKRLRLEVLPAGRDRIEAELAKLGPVRKRIEVDQKDWARRLLARHDGGEVLKPIQLRFAREALGLPVQSARAAA